MPAIGQNVRFLRLGVVYSGTVTSIINARWFMVGLRAVSVNEIFP